MFLGCWMLYAWSVSSSVLNLAMNTRTSFYGVLMCMQRSILISRGTAKTFFSSCATVCFRIILQNFVLFYRDQHGEEFRAVCVIQELASDILIRICSPRKAFSISIGLYNKSFPVLFLTNESMCLSARSLASAFATIVSYFPINNRTLNSYWSMLDLYHTTLIDACSMCFDSIYRSYRFRFFRKLDTTKDPTSPRMAAETYARTDIVEPPLLVILFMVDVLLCVWS